MSRWSHHATLPHEVALSTGTGTFSGCSFGTCARPPIQASAMQGFYRAIGPAIGPALVHVDFQPENDTMQRHGEYKMPGGKLVVADLELVAGRLERVVVSGDFFLDPDEALDAIDAALTGLPADTEAAALARAVGTSLPEGTTMFGVSPEAIAIAVRRAVDGASADRSPSA